MTQREEKKGKKKNVRVRRISAHRRTCSSIASRGDEGCVWEVVVCVRV